MIKKLLFVILFLGIFSSLTTAQSAQATMDVSVEVISGAALEASSLVSSLKLDSEDANMGSFTIRRKAFQNTLITTPNMVRMENMKGQSLILNVKDQNRAEGEVSNISLSGSVDKKNTSKGLYRGEVIATVEYL